MKPTKPVPWTPRPAEPYQPGNTAALRHGANSERLVSERAKQVLAELIERWPWLEQADGVLVDVMVKAKVRYDALDEYAAGVIEGTTEAYPRKGYPTVGVEAVPDRVWTALARQERSVIDAASKLGLAPVDRAQLFKDAGMARHFGRDGVTELAQRGRQLRRGPGST